MDRQQLKEMVARMAYPDQNKEHYFDWHSADGFAFLGYAKATLGLDYGYELQAIQERNYALNHENSIGEVKVSAANQYVYTMWTCLEFLLLIGEVRTANELVNRIRRIGRYAVGPENSTRDFAPLNSPQSSVGWQRYCSEECYLVVPNVTSAAALCFAWLGDRGKAEELVAVLRQGQLANGNWGYLAVTRDGVIGNDVIREEDCFHVAMMIYHLKEVGKIGIRTWDLVNKAWNWLIANKPRCGVCGKSGGWFCEGSVGWGVPMMWLALQGEGERDLLKRNYIEQGAPVVESYLEHENFRVRSMTAWVLSRGA